MLLLLCCFFLGGGGGEGHIRDNINIMFATYRGKVNTIDIHF